MNDEDKKIGWIVALCIAIFVFLMPGLGVWSIVGAGSVGVVTRFGAVNRVVHPGIIGKFPLIEWVHSMDTRTQKDQIDAEAASQDLQVVHSTIAVNYHLDGLHATDVYQKIGTDYQDKIVSPAIQDTFKSITAQYTAEQLITKREEVRTKAAQELTDKMAPYNIIVDNFNIVNFDFSPEFNTAIEQKQVAQQNVEKAKQQLEQAKVDAQTAVAAAQGKADAQKALRDAGSLTPEYLRYLAITEWDGKLPTYLGSGVLPFLDITVR